MSLLNNIDNSFKSRKRKALENKMVLDQLRDDTDFEKKDFLALIIAAFITLIPFVLGILFLYYSISMLLFG